MTICRRFLELGVLMIKLILAVGAGSFLGGIARFLLSKSINAVSVFAFPLATFVVNILGCFAIGFFSGMALHSSQINETWRLFLTVGFCGGFTTFSTFANENLNLLQNDHIVGFALYAALSLFVGIIAVYLGNLLSSNIFK